MRRSEEKYAKRKQKPIEEKESLRWLTGLREARKMAQELPEVQCICVADSEADIYELFAEPRGEHPVHWLIRACQDRATDGDPGHQLRGEALATPVLYEVELLVRGRKAKTAAEDRARRQNRETRRATVEVRAASMTLRPPPRPDRKLPPVTVNVVLVREPNPPAGEAGWSGSWSRPCRSTRPSRCGRSWNTTVLGGPLRFCSAR